MFLLLITSLLVQPKLIITMQSPEIVPSLGGYATEGQFPFMAALYHNQQFVCGGSVISENYILTAAHCLHNRDALDMTIILGSIEMVPKMPIVHYFNKTIIHSRFDPINQNFDIALIRLQQPVVLGTSTIDSIELSAEPEEYPANTTATIIGYAVNIGGVYTVDHLKYAYIPIWSRHECNCVIYPPIQDHMVCAGHLLGNVTSCAGDSGGPLVIDAKLYGIVAFGYGCGTRNPAVYIRVPLFRSWIMENMLIE